MSSAQDIVERLRTRSHGAAAGSSDGAKFVLEQHIEIETPVPAGEGKLTLDAVLVDAATLLRLRQDYANAMHDIETMRGQMIAQGDELTKTTKALESIRISLHRPSWTAKQKLDEAIEKSDAWALSQ